jgi:hypothetical protein
MIPRDSRKEVVIEELMLGLRITKENGGLTLE